MSEEKIKDPELIKYIGAQKDAKQAKENVQALEKVTLEAEKVVNQKEKALKERQAEYDKATNDQSNAHEFFEQIKNDVENANAKIKSLGSDEKEIGNTLKDKKNAATALLDKISKAEVEKKDAQKKYNHILEKQKNFAEELEDNAKAISRYSSDPKNKKAKDNAQKTGKKVKEKTNQLKKLERNAQNVQDAKKLVEEKKNLATALLKEKNQTDEDVAEHEKLLQSARQALEQENNNIIELAAQEETASEALKKAKEALQQLEIRVQAAIVGFKVAKNKLKDANKAVANAKIEAENLEQTVKETVPENISKLRELVQDLSKHHKKLENYIPWDGRKNLVGKLIYFHLCLILGEEPNGRRNVDRETQDYKIKKHDFNQSVTSSLKDWVNGENETIALDKSQLDYLMKTILIEQCLAHVQKANMGPGVFGQFKDYIGVSSSTQQQIRNISLTILDITEVGLKGLVTQSQFSTHRYDLLKSNKMFPEMREFINGYNPEWLDSQQTKLLEHYDKGFETDNDANQAPEHRVGMKN